MNINALHQSAVFEDSQSPCSPSPSAKSSSGHDSLSSDSPESFGGRAAYCPFLRGSILVLRRESVASAQEIDRRSVPRVRVRSCLANSLFRLVRVGPQLTSYVPSLPPLPDPSEVSLKSILEVSEKSLLEQIDPYSDFLPCLDWRKAIWRVVKAFRLLCRKVSTNPVFESFVIAVILLNTITLAMEGPTTLHQQQLFRTLDLAFLYIYTGEMALKVLGNGLVRGKDAYFRDYWNLGDAAVVFTGWIDEKYAGQGINLTALRTLRILRPLRSITRIQGMRVIFLALLGSARLLLSSITLLLFFFLIASISALQMFMGVLRYRCMDIESGYVGTEDEDICGSKSCGTGKVCVLGLNNPISGTVSFDNLLISMLTVFQSVTLEGWTSNMNVLQRGVGMYVCLFYIPLIFLGAFFFMNLTLVAMKASVLPTQFTLAMDGVKNRRSATAALNDLISNDDLVLLTQRSMSFDHVSQVLKDEYSLDHSGSNSSLKRVHVTLMPGTADPGLDVSNTSQDGMLLSRPEQSMIFPQSMLSVYPAEGFPSRQQSQGEDLVLSSVVKDSKSEIDLMPLRPPGNSSGEEARGESVGSLIPKDKIAIRVSQQWVMELTSKPDVLKLVIPVPRPAAIGSALMRYSDPRKVDEAAVSVKFSEFRALAYKGTNEEAYHALFPNSRSIATYFSAVMHIQTLRSPSDSGEMYWSGFDVRQLVSSLSAMEHANDFRYRLWTKGCIGMIEEAKYPIAQLMKSSGFNAAMTVCVVINTVVLSINHYGIDPSVLHICDLFNTVFTSIFACELLLKLLSLGTLSYFRDNMNFFDAVIVIVSVIEFAFSSGSSMTAFRSVKVFRIFRVLRVARLFRYMTYMRKIMSGIAASIAEFLYLGLLLLIFLAVFSLFGMQLFAGKFPSNRATYDTFFRSFLTNFQIMSSENWHTVLHAGMDAVGPAAAIYFVAWLFFGNFVLLNLFLAILLDVFATLHEEDAYSAETSCPLSRLARKKLDAIRRKIDAIEVESIESDPDDSEPRTDPRPQPLFVDVPCERSLCVFSKENCVRKAAYRVTSARMFEVGVMVGIAVASGKLVWETYLIHEPEESVQMQVSRLIDTVITALFALELLAKAVAQGLIFDQGTYLRDCWNILDFLIVVMSLIDVFVADIDLPVIKVFRILRVLRPLRVISHNLSMKIIVNALLESFLALLNVVVVVLLVWFIFGILGVSLFAGKMSSCDITDLGSKSMCEYYGGVWSPAPYNFDNIFLAILTLFQVTSPENWTDTMYTAMDATAVDQSMHRDSSPWAAFYFLLFLIISNFFFLNLFLAVIFDKFEKARMENTSISELILQNEQYQWVEIMKFISKTPLATNVEVMPIGFRLTIYKVVTHWWFNTAMMGCIVMNMIVMGMPFLEQPKEYFAVLEKMSTIFTVVFTVEAALKLVGLTAHRYFQEGWNRFDFAAVVASLVDLLLTSVSFGQQSSGALSVGTPFARTLRVLRVLRLFRLLRQFRVINELVAILAVSVYSILNVLALLVLVFVMYGVLGVFLFSDITQGEIIDEYNNFSNFGMATLMLIRVSTGEDWNYILKDCSSVQLSAVYFLSFIPLSTFIMFNLFVMVMLQEYEAYHHNPESSLKLYKAQLRVFNAAWTAVAQRRSRINCEELIALAVELGANIGLKKEMSRYEIRKLLAGTGLRPDKSGYIYYHEALFRFLRSKYGLHSKVKSALRKELLRKEEQRYHSRILALVRKERVKFAADLISKGVLGRPFTHLIFLKSVFSGWKEVARNSRGRPRGGDRQPPQRLVPSQPLSPPPSLHSVRR